MRFSKRLRYVRYFFEYLAVFPFYFFIRILPHSMLFPISDFIGGLFFLLPSVRKLLCANIKVAFPEKDNCEVRRIASRSASNLILALLEFFWFIDRPGMLEKYVDFPKKERDITEKNKKAGHGFIWATPHIGNWELAGLKFKHDADIPFAVVVRPLNNFFLNRIIHSGRVSEGSRVIPDKGAVKGMMKALRDGCFIATLVDQNTRAREGGIFVDFFGLPVPTSRAPALFGRKLNTPVAVGGCIRKGKRYEMFAEELPKLPSEYGSDEELIQDIMKITEKIISKYPEQYLWLYKRWLYIPGNATDEQRKRYPFYSIKVTPRFFSELAPR
jgi:KDO2-lipid IV(A) lauroyltransferase